MINEKNAPKLCLKTNVKAAGTGIGTADGRIVADGCHCCDPV